MKKSAATKRAPKKKSGASKKTARSPTAPAPKKRVVILGGSGFIGHSLAHQLAIRGYHVVATTRGESKQTDHDGETSVHWDGSDPGVLLPYVDGAFAVVNLAGEPIFGRWTTEKKKEILDSRLRVGQALLTVLNQVERVPKVLVQASAVGYYGSSAHMIDETSPPGTGFLASVCHQWEGSTAAAEHLGIRRIVIRSGIVLGKGGGAFPFILEPFRNLLGGVIGSGNQYFPFIHLDDEVRAIVYLLENDFARGQYNLVSPEPCTNRQLTEAVSRHAHLPMWFGASAVAAKLLYGQVAAETILANQRVVPKRLMESGFEFKYPTIDAVLADLLKHEVKLEAAAMVPPQ